MQRFYRQKYEFSMAFLVCLLISCAVASTAAAQEHCLLVMERRESAISAYINDGFKEESGSQLKLVLNAAPSDLIECIRNPSVRRIALVIHSAPTLSQEVNLLWFALLSGAAANSRREEIRRGIMARLEIITQELQRSRYNDNSGLSDPLVMEELQLQEAQRHIRNNPQFRVYSTNIIFDRFFQLLQRELATRARPLERLSIATCEQQKVLSRYPSINSLSNFTSLRFARASWLVSLLSGGERVAVSVPWLRAELFGP